jgi:hypothetical protein
MIVTSYNIGIGIYLEYFFWPLVGYDLLTCSYFSTSFGFDMVCNRLNQTEPATFYNFAVLDYL